MTLSQRIEEIGQLEELLSRPDERVVELFSRLEGDLMILGGGGKIGPSLVTMAARARQQAGGRGRVIVVDRFPDPAGRAAIERAGAVAVAADLMDPAAVAALPAAEHVIYMVGQKFGTSSNPALTWAVNTLIPAYVAQRYAGGRLIVFSTGCVYPLVPVESAGSVEADELTPLGEYSNACVARERIFEHFAAQHGTSTVLVRLNYAVEMRYGVLVDLAQQIAAGRPVGVSMGYFNCIWQGDVNAMVLRLLGMNQEKSGREAHNEREFSRSNSLSLSSDNAPARNPRPAPDNREQHVPPARTFPALGPSGAQACWALNLTGPEKLSTRAVAMRLAERMGRKVDLVGTEAPTALLSDASRAFARLGRPSVPAERVIDWTADWIAQGGATLGKPTHFEARDGKY